MELLHVYGPDGAEIRTEDLADRSKAIMICRTGGGIALSESVEPGADVVAALVRNEDGWALTSADVDNPVVAGPKSAPEIQLVPGLVCSVADHSFRLERDQVGAGGMLLWRTDKSKIAADPVVAGRNVVANGVADGKPSVNPALIGEVLFEFFPSADGLDLVTGVGERRQRLAVSAGTLFTVGGFEAMYLASKDAEAALKSGNPFGWPSRGVRRGLLFGICVMVGLFALSALYYRDYRSLRRELEAPRGAVAVAPQFNITGLSKSSDLRAIYEAQFFRALPELLSPETSLFSASLVRWGGAYVFSNDVQIANSVKFVKDVDEIKSLIRGAHWAELEEVIGRVDRNMFLQADAMDFLADAQELRDFVYVQLPADALAILNGSKRPEAVGEEWSRVSARMKSENRFMTDAMQSRTSARAAQYIKVMSEYIEERDRTLAAGDKLSSPQILAMTDDYCNLRDQLEASIFEKVLSLSESELRGFVDRETKRVQELPDVVENDTRRALLNPLAELAGQLGYDDATREGWRKAAKSACQRLNQRCQKLYQDYRMKGANNRAFGEKCLDDIVALGYTDSKYYAWALREKERIQKK